MTILRHPSCPGDGTGKHDIDEAEKNRKLPFYVFTKILVDLLFSAGNIRREPWPEPLGS